MDKRALQARLREKGVFVHDDDPVLEMAAVCNVAMGDAAERMEAAARNALEQGRTDAAGLFDRAVQDAANRLREAARDGAAHVLERLEEETERAKRATRRAVLAAGVSVAVAVASVVVGLVLPMVRAWFEPAAGKRGR